MIGIGIGVGLQMGKGAAAVPPPTGNLLLWTEEFSNAVWVHPLVTVVPDATAGPFSGTADTLAFLSERKISQESTTSVGAGTSVNQDHLVGTTWDRYSVTGTFGGSAFTGSCYLRFTVDPNTIYLTLSRSAGGFLIFGIHDVDGNGPFTLAAWGAQLEAGSSATAYIPRTT